MLPQSYGPIAGCITSPAALLSAYKTPNVLTETRLKNTNSVQFLYLFQPVPNVAQFSTTTGEDGPVFMLHHHPALLPKIGLGMGYISCQQIYTKPTRFEACIWV